MKLLIVEDEATIQDALCKGFRKLGYVVESAFDGEEAVNMFYSTDYSLVVLDLNLPKLSGMDVLKEIRSDDKDIPVLILSARTEAEDKIFGLDEGANDYLAKPFDFGELEARIRALLRRSFKTSDATIEMGNVTVDTMARKVLVSGKEISMTKKEYGILEYLSLRKGEAVTSAELINHIWETDTEDASTSFRVRMSTLRKKLPEGFIQSTRGHGYYVV